MTTPSTSIVILTRNQLEYTRRCVDGIAATTPEPHELVFVDNGSDDGTVEYLRSLPDATVLENDRNLGFGGGCNQGILASAGDRILLLNNDVVPAAGWLGSLHDAIDAESAVGLAGPRTNRVAGDQRVSAVDYDEETLAGLEAWAARWRASHMGQRDAAVRLIGFCLLLDRAVVDAIGGFDLRYEVGNFEDDDLCLRAGVAGFGCRIVHDSFVHHFGSRTFVGEQVDYRGRIGANYRRFADAWRIADDEIDPATGAYPAGRLLESTTWDPERHHAPLVAVPDDGRRVDLGEHRRLLVAACCDRFDRSGTEQLLRAALERFGPDDDVTLAVRVDPRDDTSLARLEAIVDDVGDEQLPDIAVVELRDEDDRPLLRVVDQVLVGGRTARGRALLARRMGVEPITVA